MTGGQGRRSWVIGATVLSAALTISGYVLMHGAEHVGQPFMFCIYVLLAQTATSFVTLCGVMASKLIRDQARILDQTHDSVSVRLLDGTLTYWNRGAVERYGWTFEEARAAPLHKLLRTDRPVPPMDVESFLALGSWEGEITAHTRDGRRVVVDCRCTVQRDDLGRPTGILTTASDLTPRHAATEELRQSEKRYRNIFATTGVSIWECDFSAVRRKLVELHVAGMTDVRLYLAEHPEFVREAIQMTRAIDVNEASLAMFGARTKEELLGSVDHLWPPESEPHFAQSIIAGWEHKPLIVGEASLRALDGRLIDLLFSTAFPPEAETRESIFVTVADITARNEAQMALREAQVDLAHAARLTSLGELTASIAHEVNQPIAGILVNGQAGLRWLSRETPDIQAAKASLTNVVSEAKRAGSVVEGIRALSRKEALHPELLDFNALLEEALLILSFELARSRIGLSMDLDSTLEPVRVDRTQLQQVVINLVMNAAQALGQISTRARQIRISSKADGTMVLVTISDNGPGVPDEIRSRLFEAFTTSRREGTGLGLSVCASIVKRHGGTIWNGETDGPGAVFAFSIPVGGPNGALDDFAPS